MISGMLLLKSKLEGSKPHPIGQQSFTDSGIRTWTVPEGVFLVCCVILSAGGQAAKFDSNTTRGSGGGVRWKNNIPVTPGQTFQIVVGNGGVSNYWSNQQVNANNYITSALGLTVGVGSQGTALSNDVGGGYGGELTWQTNNSVKGGGNSALFNSGSSDAGYNENSYFGGGGLNIVTGERIVSVGGVGSVGGGGGCNSTTSYAGGNGAVRIIWGQDRAYPSTNIADI